MIAEKLEHQLDMLEKLVNRNNGDLMDLAELVVERMRAEVDRVRELETSGVIHQSESTVAGVNEGVSHAGI